MKRLALLALLMPATLMAAALGWTPVAHENDAPVTVLQAGTVRYRAADGSNPNVADKALKAGDALSCTNGAFGDPTPGVYKECVTDNPLLLVAPVLETFGCMPYTSDASHFKITTYPEDTSEWMAAPAASAYWVATWWCETKYGATWQAGVGFKDELPGMGALASIVQYLAASTSDKRASVTQRVTCSKGADPTSPACARYADIRAIARAQAQAYRPDALPVWVVKTNGSSTTRPVYMAAGGVRSTKATTYRAPVGATCGCSSQAVEEGSSTYCSVAGVTNAVSPAVPLPVGAVALCARKP